MNRTQRRYYCRFPRRFEGRRKKNATEIEEVFPPRWKRDRVMQSRCCYTAPDQLAPGQLTDEDTDSPAEYIAAAKKLTPPSRPVHSDVTTVARRQFEKDKETTANPPKDLITMEKKTQQQKVITGTTKQAPSKLDPATQNQPKETSETQDMPSLNSPTQQRDIAETRRQMLAQDSIIKPQKGTAESRRQVLPCTDLETQQRQKRVQEARRNYGSGFYSRRQNGAEIRRLVLPTFKSVAQQYSNIEPSSPELPDKAMAARLQDIHKLMCVCARPTTENSCQYVNPIGCADCEQIVEVEKPVWEGKDEETLTKYHSVPKNLHISEVPRIKLVAVKYTKYNKDNIELRRTDEKVVCVEYDVFDEEKDETPVQKLRAFFSVKPPAVKDGENTLTEVPSTVKTKFHVSSTDLQKLSQKEIEIIDGTILENQPYLHDLRKILRRKQNYANLIKDTLNLQALYEMGKQDLLHFDCNFTSNEMTKDKLVEMQNLILKNTKSSVHGIRRMTVKNSQIFDALVTSTISKSLVNELLKGSTETVVV